MVAQKNPGTPRPYRMQRRQEALEQTRARIAAAAYELHATIGPARTTISAIAERAGVQRHTVYHHFPDLTSLFQACTAHGLRVTKFPDAARWRAVADPVERLRVGLLGLYGYYRANARLMGNVLRDMPLFADVGGAEEWDERVALVFTVLSEAWQVDDATEPALRAAVNHAMAFETWRSLTEHGMTDEQARDMMVAFVVGVAGTGATPPPA